MKIVLHFRQITLGDLKYDNGMYIYNSYEQGEREFASYLSYGLYGLQGSVNKASKELFSVFFDMIKNIRQRRDILNSAHIEDNDHDYVALLKYGRLAQCQDKFWIEVKEW